MNEVVKSPATILNNMLNGNSVQKMIKDSMGQRAGMFTASIMDVFNSTPELAKCDPAQIVKKAIEASAMGLTLNKSLGHAYLVVYNNKVKLPDGSFKTVPTPTFIPGYKGLIQLALRGGCVKNINADVVYEGELVGKDKLTGYIDLSGDKTSDKVIGYFAYYDEGVYSKTIYMSVDEMANYAKAYSKSIPSQMTIDALKALADKPYFDGNTGVGWTKNFHSMAIKTVLRRLLKTYGRLSLEMEAALNQDSKADEAEDNVVDTTAVEIPEVKVIEEKKPIDPGF